MGSRHSNWVAISYDSALAVEQALIKRGNRLSNGHIFGVQRLLNSRKFFLEEAKYGAVTANTSEDESDSLSRGLFPNATNDMSAAAADNNNNAAKELAEEDILMTSNKGRVTGKNKSVCELFMAWVYGW